MLRLILFLFLLIASIWLGAMFVSHPGYLLVVYQPWIVQMPLWFVVLSAIAILGLFYLLITFSDKVAFDWFRFKKWLVLRGEHQSYNFTQQGLIALIEGRFKKAEKWLLKGVNDSFDPVINYLGATKAAHEQQAFQRRDEYLQKAYRLNPKAELAIGLTQAELEIKQGQFEQAKVILSHLQTLSPRHPRVLKLLEKVYVHLGEWDALKGLLPSIRKTKLLSKEEVNLFEKNIYCELIRNTAKLSDLRMLWQQVPRYLRKHPDVVLAYVTQLSHHAPTTGAETSKEMESLIRGILKNNWSPALVTMYGQLPLNNLNRQLVIVGAWVKLHGQQPELMLLLGKLCVRLQLWGRAKEYFVKCLAAGTNPAASLEYGRLLERLGQSNEALKAYQQGLM